MSNLQYYVGKMCTIFIGHFLKDFPDPHQFVNYFFGRVESIDSKGLTLLNAKTGCKSFFFLDKIEFIAEEQKVVLDPVNDAEIIQQIDETLNDPQTVKDFIDITHLENLRNKGF